MQKEIDDLQLHTAEMEKLLDEISALGKISYFVGNAGDESDVRLADIYACIMENDDQIRFRQAIRQIYSGKISSYQNSCNLTVNNQKRHHNIGITLFEHQKTGTRKLLLVDMDISEIENRRNELAKADTILETIFDNLPGYIFIKEISSDFAYVKCNHLYSGLIQLQPYDVKGKSDFDLFKRELAENIRTCDLNIARTQGIADNRWFFTTPDGKEHAIRFIARAMKQPDGTQWIIGFGVDVTRQERTANKLRHRNKELRLLLKSMSEEAMLLDNDLELCCATTPMQAYFPENILSEESNEKAVCRILTGCQVSNEQECAACQALSDRRKHICSKSNRIGKALKISPLVNEEGLVCYLAVSTLDSVSEECKINTAESDCEA